MRTRQMYRAFGLLSFLAFAGSGYTTQQHEKTEAWDLEESLSGAPNREDLSDGNAGELDIELLEDSSTAYPIIKFVREVAANPTHLEDLNYFNKVREILKLKKKTESFAEKIKECKSDVLSFTWGHPFRSQEIELEKCLKTLESALRTSFLSGNDDIKKLLDDIHATVGESSEKGEASGDPKVAG